jgi:hypothetical protein
VGPLRDGLRGAAVLLFAFAVAAAGCAKRADTGGHGAGADSGASFHGGQGEPSVAALARRVVEAHGGIPHWMAVRTVRYTEKLTFAGQDKPWVSTETVEEGPLRRLYQDWKNHGGSLTWDGKEVWTVDWNLPNPPALMPYLNYYSLITPWLVFTPGVSVEDSGEATIPGGDGTRYPSFTLRFAIDTTLPPVASFYKILVDPKTGRMKATTYAISYGPFLDRLGLPPQATETEPITHVYDEFTRVGGLLLPSRYHTVASDGSPVGSHEVTGWELNVPFDESRMKKPPNAVVDTASFARKQTP